MTDYNNAATISNTERWLITITVMLVAVIEVIDITIVNVSLPNMMGSLSANFEEITWVLTSYIVSAAIFMPLTGFLVKRYGRRRLLLANIIGFMSASFLCGLSTSLFEIVLFRTLQGIFGASLVPLSQFILRDTFPKSEQGKAMAIWGIGIMAGPILGPALGGYITDLLNWRWIFFINIPVCMVAFIMTLNLISETPTQRVKIDWLGLSLMTTGIGCLQIFLDRGNIDDWFASKTIICLFFICITALTLFIVRGIRRDDNIINLQLFRDPNFGTCSFLMMTFGICLFGMLAVQPLMMINLFNYSTTLAGLVMAPRGLASAFGMVFVARTIKIYDPRLIVSSGLIFAAIGTYFMSRYNLMTDVYFMIWPALIQGFGMGLFFVPLTVLAFDTLIPQDAAEAAGLFSFSRNLGSSIGISICSTLLSRQNQVHWNTLGGHLQPANPLLHVWLSQHHTSIQSPLALLQLMNTLRQQAGMLSFINIYWFLTIGFIVMLPLIYTMKRPKAAGVQDLMH